ncbi:MAG: hypothetical protein QOE14_2673, partial [Humisphaera sp.]|nr:hypothetical protein [Humisphaera sp.]
MNMASLDVGGVRVFEARQRVGLQAALCIAGGVLFFLMLIVMFLIALGSKSTTSNDMMPGMIGGLSVFGIGLIGRGVFLLRGVVRVTLDNNAVHLDGFTARRTVSYQQIERIERDKKNQLLGGKTHQVLLLYAAGERKPLAIIPDTIENFEELATELARRSAAAQGGRTTYDPIADQQIRDRRDSRRMKFTSAAFSVITLLFIVMLCFGVNEEIHNRRLQSRGTAVYARIDKHFMRSVTPYIEYSFADAQGKRQSREVMVTELLYGQTREGQLVPVVYLADQPEWNRLVGGEAGKNFGGKFLFLLGGGTLMFGAFAVMTLLGIDIKSENGRTTIVRRGKVIREFGAKPLET